MPAVEDPLQTPQKPDSEPFLRWLGSKRATATSIASLIPSTRGRYFEPFLGGGAVFFASGTPRAVLSDILEPLIEVYTVVKERPEQVANVLERFAAESQYYSVRALDTHGLDAVERAGRFVYLNANCFNGLYRTNRAGDFNVPLGTRAGRLPTRRALTQASEALANAELLTKDAKDVVLMAEEDDFVYLDPPHLTSRPAYGEYGYHGFGEKEWRHLLHDVLPHLQDRGAHYAISLPATLAADRTDRAISGARCIDVPMSYRIGGNGHRSRLSRELLLTNSPLIGA